MATPFSFVRPQTAVTAGPISGRPRSALLSSSTPFSPVEEEFEDLEEEELFGETVTDIAPRRTTSMTAASTAPTVEKIVEERTTTTTTTPIRSTATARSARRAAATASTGVEFINPRRGMSMAAPIAPAAIPANLPKVESLRQLDLEEKIMEAPTNRPIRSTANLLPTLPAAALAAPMAPTAAINPTVNKGLTYILVSLPLVGNKFYRFDNNLSSEKIHLLKQAALIAGQGKIVSVQRGGEAYEFRAVGGSNDGYIFPQKYAEILYQLQTGTNMQNYVISPLTPSQIIEDTSNDMLVLRFY